MRLGVFVSVFIALLVVMALLYPARTDITVPQGQPQDSVRGAECFTLAYRDSSERSARLPTEVQLLTDTAFGGANRGVFVARSNGQGMWNRTWWAYAGADSIDISAHHEPILRIPRGLTSGVGRAIPYVDGSLLVNLLVPPREVVVEAKTVPCGSQVTTIVAEIFFPVYGLGCLGIWPSGPCSRGMRHGATP